MGRSERALVLTSASQNVEMDNRDSERLLKYLGIETPLPSEQPLEFLKLNLLYLPKELLQAFSPVLTPKERTVVPAIRNRRVKYTQSAPRELSWMLGKNTWPLLWEGRERRGIQEGEDERVWAKEHFLGGERKQLVGNLGGLLGDYEEEREADRIRQLRRERAEQKAALPEEEEETDSDEEEVAKLPPEEPPSDEEMKRDFERVIREKFIYGLLEVEEGADYDGVDWDDHWDQHNLEADEERWFDEEEEC